MSAHRSKGLVIGAHAALALGLWQTDTAKADHRERGGCGGSSYSSNYYSDYGGYAPVYVEPSYYPTRTYYSESYYNPRPYRSGFNFSLNIGRDRGYHSGHHRSSSRHGGHHGRRGW